MDPPRSRRVTPNIQPFKSELRKGSKGKVYMSIAPSGHRNGPVRPDLSALTPQGHRLLTPARQAEINAILAEENKDDYKSMYPFCFAHSCLV
jgi:hypothetical protein